MSLPLHRQVAPPRSLSPVRVAAFGVSFGLLAGAACFVAFSGLHHGASHVYVTVPGTPVATAESPTVMVEQPEAVAEPAPEPATIEPVRGDFAFTFRLDGSTYLSLAELPNVKDPHAKKPAPRTSVPKHGPLRLIGKRAYAEAAAAFIDPADLPPRIRAWRGREVVVGGTCLARVTGFELIARSMGGWEWHYSADDVKNKSETELAQKLFSVGQAVIAARLDGCTGTYARDASRPAIVRGVPADEYLALARAKKQLIASPEGAAAGKKWRAAGNKSQWDKAATIKERAVRHPGTGKVYLSVHAVLDEGCGGADINLWRLYELDGAGKLTLVRKSQPVGVASIDEFVDVDGDGAFEFIAHDSTVGQDVVLWSHDGSERMRLSTPFYGCPC